MALDPGLFTGGVSNSAFDLLGGGIGSIGAGLGGLAASKAYTRASQIALQNAKLSKESTAIQETQAQRQIFQTVGAQQAAVGSAGFASSGSNLDLMRSSLNQGALQKQVIQTQGLINENGFEAQATAYQGQAAASKSSGIAGILGGALKIGMSLFSDDRMKRNVVRIGPSHIDGIDLYRFQYIGGNNEVFEGVLASEVAKVRPDCVTKTGGYDMVDYARLGIDFKEAA